MPNLDRPELSPAGDYPAEGGDLPGERRRALAAGPGPPIRHPRLCRGPRPGAGPGRGRGLRLAARQRKPRRRDGPSSPDDPAAIALPAEPPSRPPAQEARRNRQLGRGPAPDPLARRARRYGQGLPSRRRQRSEGERPGHGRGESRGGPRLHSPPKEPGATLRSPSSPESLRRRPMAGRVRRPAGGLSRPFAAAPRADE